MLWTTTTDSLLAKWGVTLEGIEILEPFNPLEPISDELQKVVLPQLIRGREMLTGTKLKVRLYLDLE
ncbi:hypothetical protein NPIL_481041 [Nephila pilipes]|uniref:Uncharacterized protein n=1 Tax=Nephila pilipes TaxID=299642 RepID=A0A8X6PEA0_NEPPI|nr:hypothetical protein NPIL_481041 [Nephila pilipes]